MTYEFKLAAKYARAPRKSLAHFTSVVAVVGIAAGIASLLVAQGLTRGFQSEIQDKILANTSHITIYEPNGAEIADWQTIVGELEKIENVRGVTPTAYESALLVTSGATNYCVLRATENHSALRVPHSAFRVAVGAELAERNDLKIGDQAEIVLPNAHNNYAPQTAKVVVGDVFRTGLYDYDAAWIRIAPEDLARIRQRVDFVPSVLSVSVADIYLANETAEELRRNLSPKYKIIDWQQANQPLFAALGLERKVALAIILLIIFIAALNITTTLALLVGERRLDIAVLKICGAQTRSVILIFLYEGLFLGFLGIALGVFFGWLLCLIENYFKIISLPGAIYSLNYVPLKLNAGDLLVTVSVTLLLVLAAIAYPARQAAKIKPAENLQRR